MGTQILAVVNSWYLFKGGHKLTFYVVQKIRICPNNYRRAKHVKSHLSVKSTQTSELTQSSEYYVAATLSPENVTVLWPKDF